MGGRSPALVLQRHGANMALLRGLLSAPVRAAPRQVPARRAPQQDDLLAELLELDRPRGKKR
jgi:hypothetical protein